MSAAGTASSEAVLRKGGLLLAARLAQAAFSAATFLLVTRRLGPAGSGELATALSVSGTLGGVVSAALVDSAVVSSDASTQHRNRLVTWWVGAAGLLTIGVAVALRGAANTVAGVLGGVAVTTLTVGTSDRLAYARTAGHARHLSAARFAGGGATLAAVALLLRVDAGWGAIVCAFAFQPLLLLLLPKRRAEPASVPVRPVAGWSSAAPYLVAQTAWLVLAESPIILLRTLDGPSAAGRLAAMTRLLDLLALVGPIMANFALPAFVTNAARGNDGRSETGRLNALVALVGVLTVASGAQAGWLFWKLAFPHDPFPVVEFAVLTLAVGVNAAGGLPDRVLQAAGRASAVSTVAVTTAAFLLGASTIAISRFGLLGCVGARFAGSFVSNVVLLALASLPAAALAASASLMVASLGTAIVVASRFAELSLVKTALSGAAAAVMSLLLASPFLLSLQRTHARLRDAASSRGSPP